MSMSAVLDVATLKALTLNRSREFRLALNGGAYSRKTIRYSPTRDEFAVFNHIDDSRQTLKPAELWTKSNIGLGIDRGALYWEA